MKIQKIEMIKGLIMKIRKVRGKMLRAFLRKDEFDGLKQCSEERQGSRFLALLPYGFQPVRQLMSPAAA